MQGTHDLQIQASCGLARCDFFPYKSCISPNQMTQGQSPNFCMLLKHPETVCVILHRTTKGLRIIFLIISTPQSSQLVSTPKLIFLSAKVGKEDWEEGARFGRTLSLARYKLKKHHKIDNTRRTKSQAERAHTGQANTPFSRSIAPYCANPFVLRLPALETAAIATHLVGPSSSSSHRREFGKRHHPLLRCHWSFFKQTTWQTSDG